MANRKMFRKAEFVAKGGLYPFFCSSLIARDEVLDIIASGEAVIVSSAIEIAVYANGQKVAIFYSYCPN